MDVNRENFRAVSLSDPAIDLERSRLQRYRETRDLAHLVFLDPSHMLDGEPVGEPEVFELRAIDARFAHANVLSAADDTARLRAAFQASVVRVTGWRGGDDRKTWMPDAVASGRSRGFLLTEDEMALFDPMVIEEIGEVARTRLFLGPRRRGLKFDLPLSYQWLLMRMPHVAAALLEDMKRPTGPNE